MAKNLKKYYEVLDLIDDEDYGADYHTCIRGGPAKLIKKKYREEINKVKKLPIGSKERKKAEKFLERALREIESDPRPDCDSIPEIDNANTHKWKYCEKLKTCVPDCDSKGPWTKKDAESNKIREKNNMKPLKPKGKYSFYINEDKKNGKAMYLNKDGVLRCKAIDEIERLDNTGQLEKKMKRSTSKYETVNTQCRGGRDGDAECSLLLKEELKEKVRKTRPNISEDELNNFVEKSIKRIKPQCKFDNEKQQNVCVTFRDLDRDGKIKPMTDDAKEREKDKDKKGKKMMKRFEDEEIQSEIKKNKKDEKKKYFEMVAEADKQLEEIRKRKIAQKKKEKKAQRDQILNYLNAAQENLACKTNFKDWGVSCRQGDNNFLKTVRKKAKENWLILGEEGDPKLANDYKKGKNTQFKTLREKQTHLDCSKRGAFHYQRMLNFLVNPSSPIERLLVSHQLGTGKTLGMIGILENFYDCGQPMLLFFHRPALVTNFYEELLEKDNKFKKYVVETLKNPPNVLLNKSPFRRSGNKGNFKPCDFPVPPKNGSPAMMAKYRKDKANYLIAVNDLLAMKNNVNNGCVQCQVPGAPSAPLRAFSYVEGGSSAFRKDPMFRFNQRTSANDDRLFDSCIIMVDEAHVLMEKALEESFDTLVQKKNVRRFRKRLMGMKYEPSLLMCWGHPDQEKRGGNVIVGDGTKLTKKNCNELEVIKNEKTIFSGTREAKALLKKVLDGETEKKSALEKIGKNSCVNMQCRPGSSLFQRGRVVFFTATPIVKHSDDRIEMMNIVKGDFLQKAPDKHFISYFMDRPRGTFAESFYREDFPDYGIRKVVIRGEALRTYICNRFQVKSDKKDKTKKLKDKTKVDEPCKNVVRPTSSVKKSTTTTKEIASSSEEEKTSVNNYYVNDDIIFSPSDCFDPWYKNLITNKKLKLGDGNVVMEKSPHPNIQRYENMNSNRYTMRQLKSGNNKKNIENKSKVKTKVKKLESQMVTGQDHAGFKEHAPKLYAIAQTVKSAVKSADKKGKKVAVMMHKTNGLDILAHYLKIGCQEEIKDVLYLGHEFNGDKKEFVSVKNEAKVQGMLDSYNSKDNKYGEKTSVVLLDPKYFTEGISLKDVQLFILGDISTGVSKDDANWGLFKQRVGRVFRTCGHMNLEPKERKVKILVFLATFPSDYKEFKEKSGSTFRPVKSSLKTYEEHKLDAMRKQYENIEENGMKYLKKNSIEEGIKEDFYKRK